MSDDQLEKTGPDPAGDPLERNIEGLLKKSYKPELPDEAFVQRTTEMLRRAAQTAHAPRVRTVVRWRVLASSVAALLALAFVAGWELHPRGTATLETLKDVTKTTEGRRGTPAVHDGLPSVADAAESAPAECLVPRPLPPQVLQKPMDVGQSIATGVGERRRLALPDGSTIYLQERTSVRLTAHREVKLLAGVAYLEVAPLAPALRADDAPSFTVETPHGKLHAHGTKFLVRTGKTDDALTVVQGRVSAEGGNTSVVVGSGMQAKLAGGALTPPMPAPRTSCTLDWAEDLMPEPGGEGLVPGSQYGGGALIAIDPMGQEVKLSLRKYAVDVYVEDGFARTTIDQTYFNNDAWRMEGTFYFPLPPDASLSRLAMYVDGKLMEGGMAERDYARDVFEQIVTRRKDPALLEWVDGSTFKMRVFPLEGRQGKRIVLSYTQKLSDLYGKTTYRFPAGHNLQMVRDWGVHFHVKNGANLSWYCPSHALKAATDGADLALDAEARQIKPDKDVVLELSDFDAAAGSGGSQARLATATHEDAQYLMLRCRPNLPAPGARARRDWVILFESSGDRDPLLARAQVEIVRGLLDYVEHDDTFAVLSAGTRVNAWTPEARPATPENIAAAVSWLEHTHLVGALDLEQALAATAPFVKAAANPYLVHIGNGTPILGEKRADVLAKSIPAGAHYVGVGVGRRWARAFMKQAAALTGGYFTQINPDEPLRWRAFELSATLNTPRLLNLTVTDEADKLVFLSQDENLSQGEELCAIARLPAGAALPRKLTVKGLLDGEVFSQTVPVEAVARGADYLPRTWAKLEIDRLLAENGEQNKTRIVELSKAMYVMSPYTSLLVLENDAMYRQFNVDRGRKDHWALYPCPDTIPVVYEPDPSHPDPRAASNVPAKKPSISDVLETILIRIPPRMLYNPNYGYNSYQNCLTAGQYYSGAYGVPSRWTCDPRWSFFSLSSLPVRYQDGWALAARAVRDIGQFSWDGRFSWQEQQARRNLNAWARENLSDVNGGNINSPPGDRFASGGSLNLGYALRGGLSDSEYAAFDGRLGLRPSMRQSGQDLSTKAMADASAPLPNFRARLTSQPSVAQAAAARAPAMAVNRERSSPFSFIDHDRRTPLYARALDRMAAAGNFEMAQDELADLDYFEDDISITYAGNGFNRIYYSRPQFSNDQRVFTDLLSYAPGLNTSEADIQAVLEAEAEPQAQAGPGQVDPQARALIEKARTVSWRRITIPAAEREAKYDVTWDGADRYTYRRLLTEGLREEVYCDGQTLLHVYPELGLSAKRAVSRFHREELGALIPWALPGADDLACGADLSCIAANTIAVTPRQRPAPDAKGQAASYVVLQLIFGADGQLAQRRWLEQPSGKTLARQEYTQGVVWTFDGEDKERQERLFTLSAADAPELAPQAKDLVIVPLPLRTQVFLASVRKIQGNYSRWSTDDALSVIAAGMQNQWEAQQVAANRFFVPGDRRLGLYVLLLGGGASVQKEELDYLSSIYPKSNLARYIVRQLEISRNARYDKAEFKLSGDGFVERLSEFREMYWRWNQGYAQQGTAEQQKEECARAMDFVNTCSSPLFGWAMFTRLIDCNGGTDYYPKLAEAAKTFARIPALAYYARYEEARARRRTGQSHNAGELFRKLFEETIAAGHVPLFDYDFSNALRPQGTGDQWSALLRDGCAALARAGHRPLAIQVAYQCHRNGDQPLAEDLLSSILDGMSEKERVVTTLSAVEYLRSTQQFPRADALLTDLLADPKLKEDPSLWRLSAAIANQRGMLARALSSLEQAMDLEYRQLPDVINLAAVRQDYGQLLGGYRQLADAVATLQTQPPREFVSKVIRMTDRWRALDDDPTLACQAAARILQSLGAADLSWDYLTTPLAAKPNEAQGWVAMARSLSADGDTNLADKAYAQAFAAEPTNAQILFDRAQHLQQSSRPTEARQLYRQLADGAWQPRFENLKQQARRFLGDK